MASPIKERSSHSDNNGPHEQQEKHPKERQSLIQHQLPATSIMGIAPPSADYVLPLSHVEAHLAYSYPNPYYGNMVAAYGAQTVVHPQVVGIQAGVPLPSDAVEEPVYVNAKQYHGILRRRQSRAKAESENKMLKCRKPYLHESRHLHALRRARGNGGRFLNAKSEKDDLEDAAASHANAKSPSSQDLERCNVENQMQNRRQIIRSGQEN